MYGFLVETYMYLHIESTCIYIYLFFIYFCLYSYGVLLANFQLDVLNPLVLSGVYMHVFTVPKVNKNLNFQTLIFLIF